MDVKSGPRGAWGKGGDAQSIEHLSLDRWPESRAVIEKAITLSASRTISVPTFIRALREASPKITGGHAIYAQVLAFAFSGDRQRLISEIPKLQAVLDELEHHAGHGDDFQYSSH